ncbi:MAG TPA: hypothetical protein VK162_06290 [Streptosporangiaceae bacterium]|nr:hypothetical protein [Streptosporangiaceae bacterium]
MATAELAAATVIAGPAPAPWKTRNTRLEGPAGLQLTLFSGLAHPSTNG